MKKSVKVILLSLLLASFVQTPQAMASAGLGGGPTQSTKELWRQAMNVFGGAVGIIGDTFGTPGPALFNTTAGPSIIGLSVPACACGTQNPSLMDAMLVTLGNEITGVPFSYFPVDEAKKMIDNGKLIIIDTCQYGALWHYKGDLLAHGGDFLEVLQNGSLPKDKYIYPYAT